MALSDKLKQARLHLKKTQPEIAHSLNITVRTLARYENGSILPPMDKLEALAKLYNVPLTYLVSDSEDSNSSVRDWIATLPAKEMQQLSDYINQLLADKEA
ncbi:helix-turn-helix domain-containing protein [Enterococcus songbeiensis]|uniref:helix-turn-helix domain-containing protein n=1 Tax=Enterococcus songbeiensis TaxID=2559927 RepID=UPI0010F7B5CA|nr:helix-turn-helix transcriptional regulator [Enterococcus songbeiensis]